VADYIPNNRTIKLEGFAEFEEQLKAMAQGFRADTLARRTLALAARDAMQPVEAAAKAMAAYDENNTDKIHMRDTIRIDSRIPNERDKKSNFVNETDAVIAVVSVKRSAVSLANEFGTAKMPARPFLRPALDSNVDAVLGILKTRLATVIPEYALKLSRRRKK
jgi:HK97 gp10 family phage protein